MEIDINTYIPQIGDKIERTDTRSGTVTVGVVSSINGYGNPFDSSKKWLFTREEWVYSAERGDYTYRLLSRKPKDPVVGEEFVLGEHEEFFMNLPPGTVYVVADSVTHDPGRPAERVRMVLPNKEVIYSDNSRKRMHTIVSMFGTGMYKIIYLPD